MPVPSSGGIAVGESLNLVEAYGWQTGEDLSDVDQVQYLHRFAEATATAFADRNRLADQGNTVVVIEHNLDVIKTADWVIDLGPGGGVNGGQIVVEGTPETVAATKESFTGQYLKPLLERASVKPTVVEAKPKRPARSRKAFVDEDEPDLIAAK